MATDVAIGGPGLGTLFVGEDKVLRLEVLQFPAGSDPAVDDINLVGVPIDTAGWDVLFDVRFKDNSADPAMVSKTSSVTGTFNSVRATNTQRRIVTLTDTEMNLFKGSNLPSGAKTYRHSWKRMDDGSETVLARGDFSPEKATAP